MRRLLILAALLALVAPAAAQQTGSQANPFYVVPTGSGTVTATQFAATPVSAVTRINNTTTYTANTGWCTLSSSCVTTFAWTAACSAAAKIVYIPQIDVYSSANPTVKLQGILWLFKAVPGTIIADDATFNIAAADFANLTGGSFNGIPFTLGTSQASGAANSGVSLTGLSLVAECASGAATIYGMVQVVNAYVPASQEVLTIKLNPLGTN